MNPNLSDVNELIDSFLTVEERNKNIVNRTSKNHFSDFESRNLNSDEIKQKKGKFSFVRKNFKCPKNAIMKRVNGEDICTIKFKFDKTSMEFLDNTAIPLKIRTIGLKRFLSLSKQSMSSFIRMVTSKDILEVFLTNYDYEKIPRIKDILKSIILTEENSKVLEYLLKVIPDAMILDGKQNAIEERIFGNNQHPNVHVLDACITYSESEKRGEEILVKYIKQQKDTEILYDIFSYFQIEFVKEYQFLFFQLLQRTMQIRKSVHMFEFLMHTMLKNSDVFDRFKQRKHNRFTNCLSHTFFKMIITHRKSHPITELILAKQSSTLMNFFSLTPSPVANIKLAIVQLNINSPGISGVLDGNKFLRGEGYRGEIDEIDIKYVIFKALNMFPYERYYQRKIILDVPYSDSVTKLKSSRRILLDPISSDNLTKPWELFCLLRYISKFTGVLNIAHKSMLNDRKKLKEELEKYKMYEYHENEDHEDYEDNSDSENSVGFNATVNSSDSDDSDEEYHTENEEKFYNDKDNKEFIGRIINYNFLKSFETLEIHSSDVNTDYLRF